LAIGVVGHRSGDDELARSRRRVGLAYWARHNGFSLLETFEVNDGRVAEPATLLEVAVSTGATVVLALGRLDIDRLSQALDESSLAVIAVDIEAPGLDSLE
jgi:hypothetical protein